MAKQKMTLDPELAAEAKSIVALAFRNGPIEDIHAGKNCPACSGKSEYSLRRKLAIDGVKVPDKTQYILL
jgi:hypothetical protein